MNDFRVLGPLADSVERVLRDLKVVERTARAAREAIEAGARPVTNASSDSIFRGEASEADAAYARFRALAEMANAVGIDKAEMLAAFAEGVKAASTL